MINYMIRSTRPSILKYLFDLFELIPLLYHHIPLLCHKFKLHLLLLHHPLLIHLLHIPSHKVESHAVVKVLLFF